jgi:GrpB-like predicted nucleotidyltransferase (UPF0157 family)
MSEIEIVPYSAKWPALFQQEQVLLQKHIGRFLTAIHHVGSTAIPQMPSKPIVDITAECKIYPPNNEIITVLAAIKYIHMGESGVVGRHWFKKGSPTTCHLHLTPIGGDVASRQIKFRDILRQNPNLASRYAELKLSLVQQYGNDEVTYALNKTDFIRQVLKMENSQQPAAVNERGSHH